MSKTSWVDAAAMLREWRTERRLTQRQLAERIGTNDQAISDWEVGRKIPSARMMFAIDDLTDIPARAWVTAPEMVA